MGALVVTHSRGGFLTSEAMPGIVALDSRAWCGSLPVDASTPDD
jgi:hypothetical protein